MNRLLTTSATMLVLALAGSGCARNRNIPTQLAPSQVTTLAVNTYLWRAAVDTVSFAPLLQANPSSGVIITDWYTNPKAPGERVKLTVAVLDPDLRADALRVPAARQVYHRSRRRPSRSSRTSSSRAPAISGAPPFRAEPRQS
jgi:hypothetical protein